MKTCPECGRDVVEPRVTVRLYCGRRCKGKAAHRRRVAEEATDYRPPAGRCPADEETAEARVRALAERAAQGLPLFPEGG